MLYQTEHNSTLPPAGQTVTLVVLFIRSIVITSAYGNTKHWVCASSCSVWMIAVTVLCDQMWHYIKKINDWFQSTPTEIERSIETVYMRIYKLFILTCYFIDRNSASVLMSWREKTSHCYRFAMQLKALWVESLIRSILIHQHSFTDDPNPTPNPGQSGWVNVVWTVWMRLIVSETL